MKTVAFLHPQKSENTYRVSQYAFCLISLQPSIRFSNNFFLLKTEIHTHILHTEPFLCDKRVPRYLQNKMGFWNRSIFKGFRLAKQITGDHIKKGVSKIIFFCKILFSILQIQPLVQDLNCFKLFSNIFENWIFGRNFCWYPGAWHMNLNDINVSL